MIHYVTESTQCQLERDTVITIPFQHTFLVDGCSSFGMRFGYYAVLQLIVDVVVICGSNVCHFSGSHCLETRTYYL